MSKKNVLLSLLTVFIFNTLCFNANFAFAAADKVTTKENSENAQTMPPIMPPKDMPSAKSAEMMGGMPPKDMPKEMPSGMMGGMPSGMMGGMGSKPALSNEELVIKFKEFDSNADGSLDWSEFSVAYPKMQKPAFEAMDANKNNLISQEEWMEFRTRHSKENAGMQRPENMTPPAGAMEKAQSKGMGGMPSGMMGGMPMMITPPAKHELPNSEAVKSEAPSNMPSNAPAKSAATQDAGMITPPKK